MLFNDPTDADGFLLSVDTNGSRTRHAPPMQQCAQHGVSTSRCATYCLAICHRRDVRSLRDLRPAHLPLLGASSRWAARRPRHLCLPADKLRVFVHYQPQFYHFHVHFTRLHSDLGCQVERAHLLPDIIANLEADGSYYAKRTIYYQLKANDKLLAKIQEHQGQAGESKQAVMAAADAEGGRRRRARSPKH